MILILVFVCAGQNALAQNFLVSGTVISNEDHLPVIGASVLEKGTQNGSITNADGMFKMEVATSASRIIDFYIGLESIEVNVAGQSAMNISMNANKSLLDEVIITGYKKEIRSEVSASIASIKSKDIDKLVVQSVEQALQGQAPGVMVTQATGAPGDDIAVRIRGAAPWAITIRYMSSTVYPNYRQHQYVFYRRCRVY